MNVGCPSVGPTAASRTHGPSGIPILDAPQGSFSRTSKRETCGKEACLLPAMSQAASKNGAEKYDGLVRKSKVHILKLLFVLVALLNSECGTLNWNS